MHHLSPNHYQKLIRAIEFIHRWEPDWRPTPDSGEASIWIKLEVMGLTEEFLRLEKTRQGDGPTP